MAEQRGADAVSAEEQIFQARRRPPTPELPGALEGQLSLADLDAGPEADLMALPVRSDTTDMQQPVPSISEPGAGRSLDPNRVSIWPVECGGYGIDFTYHGATGYTDAKTAEQMQAAGLTTSFRREIDGAWTVRFGPLPRDHMRAVLDHFAW